MLYPVLRNKKLISKIEERLYTLRCFGVSKTNEELLETAIYEYLNKKEYHVHFSNLRKKHGFKIWNSHEGKCFYCHQYVDYKSCTFDHKHPIFRGGSSTDLNNVVPACFWCNNDKANLTAEEYSYKQLANAAKGIYPPIPYNGNVDTNSQ